MTRPLNKRFSRLWYKFGEEMVHIQLLFLGLGSLAACIIGFTFVCVNLPSLMGWIAVALVIFWGWYGLIAWLLTLWDKAGIRRGEVNEPA